MNNDGSIAINIGASVVILFIAFWGEPDLVDVLIQYIQHLSQ